jgi:hypothetical protein
LQFYQVSFRHSSFVLEVVPIWLIGAKKTYRASLLRSIEEPFRIMNATKKKAPPILIGGAFLCFKRWTYSAFASGAFSPCDKL